MLKLLPRLSLLLALLPGIGWGVAIESLDLPDPTVKVSDQEGTLVLNISYRVPVSPREAWEVLTDFENMPHFIPNVESSTILQRTEKTMQVEQKGSISLGILPIHYESKRQIDIVPYHSIRSHTLSGNTRLESIMVLTPAGKGTLLSYHATAVPDLPIPNSLVSSYMSGMLENQFKAMGQEMVRRAQSGNHDDGNIDTQVAQQPGQPIAQQVVGQPVNQAATQQDVKQTSLTPKKPRTQTKKRPG
jgi:ribosome-associated toxin RatA of RatAB toxin-antitoxin module